MRSLSQPARILRTAQRAGLGVLFCAFFFPVAVPWRKELTATLAAGTAPARTLEAPTNALVHLAGRAQTAMLTRRLFPEPLHQRRLRRFRDRKFSMQLPRRLGRLHVAWTETTVSVTLVVAGLSRYGRQCF